MAKHSSIPLKNAKEEKEIWKLFGKSKIKNKRDIDITKKFRIVQSVKAGHIRGGHAFH